MSTILEDDDIDFEEPEYFMMDSPETIPSPPPLVKFDRECVPDMEIFELEGNV